MYNDDCRTGVLGEVGIVVDPLVVLHRLASLGTPDVVAGFFGEVGSKSDEHKRKTQEDGTNDVALGVSSCMVAHDKDRLQHGLGESLKGTRPLLRKRERFVFRCIVGRHGGRWSGLNRSRRRLRVGVVWFGFCSKLDL